MIFTGVQKIEVGDSSISILTEYNTVERTVHMNLTSHDGADVSHQGHSIGWWEGDTLVVETTNFNDKIQGRGGTVFGGDKHLRVVERFTRVDGDTIDYEITVTNPTVWTEPWTVSVPMTALTGDDGAVFEYACHEGNYALPNILSGARFEEMESGGQQ